MISIMSPKGKYLTEEVCVPAEAEGTRLDKYASQAFPDFSRAFLQKAIKEGNVTINGAEAKPKTPVTEGDQVRVVLPILKSDHLHAEDIPLEVIYEDEHFLAVNKPAHMVVHPSRGHGCGTLANALLHHCRKQVSDLNGPLRPGIIHRLDRDTSGIILCAKSNPAHAGLGEQFRNRLVRKQYLAIVRGRMEYDSGEIKLPLGRDPRHRERMRVQMHGGRDALSRYYVEERFERFTFVRIEPKTGRTHQIRVHLTAQKHPVAADRLYGGGDVVRPCELKCHRLIPDEEPVLTRQALHASRIFFTHPVTHKAMELGAPLPDDMEKALEILRSTKR
jgi:23S rRNA pseudouridine1911/1915/1917 synthase